jgi:V/A-type H+-transporting ATPase subunit I
MAKIPLEKVAVYVHYSEREKLLSILQDEGLLHFVEIKQDLREEFETSHPVEAEYESHLEGVVLRLKNAIKFLEPFARKKSFVESLYEQKHKIEREEFFRIANCVEPGSLLLQVETLEQELNQLHQEESNLKAQRDFIYPWINLDYDLETIKSGDDIVILPGSVPSKNLIFFENSPLCYELSSDDGKRAYVVVVYHKHDEDSARAFLQEKEFEQVEFHGYFGKPVDILKGIEENLKRLEEEKRGLKDVIAKISGNYEKLLILHDYYESLLHRELTDNKGLKTSQIAHYTGYVKKSDIQRLERVFSNFRSAFFEIVAPLDGETAPVFIENKKAFKPFEGLVRMYGLPSVTDPDPTVLITPFFILFFGICFGDAAYGLILAVLSYLIMKKLKISAGLLWILIAGGILSMVFGALTGGWFGDFLERANWTQLNAFRKKLMLFDPMEDVLVFFGLTIALGFVQVLVGLGVNAYKRIKDGDVIGAVSQPVAWIIILLSLLYKAALASRVNSPFLNALTTILILFFIGMMVLFSSARSRNFIIRIVKGAYNVYNGVGFIGDLLSYVRLMALGMTSSGIAMAINILTLLVWQIPVAKYVLAPVVFIFGHLFSVFINILGSIVHPLRLQYVEFFKQFYDDGGKPFDPLRWVGKFTEITENIKQEV